MRLIEVSSSIWRDDVLLAMGCLRTGTDELLFVTGTNLEADRKMGRTAEGLLALCNVIQTLVPPEDP